MNQLVKLCALGIAMSLAACTEQGGDDGQASKVLSLTGSTFKGKKLYLGWGHAGQGDPENMHNEVKYDVLHTHEIFTKELGGTYTGTKLLANGSTEAIVSAFNQIKSQSTADDMFVQYSSGHGFQQGLQYGGNYTDIASRILSLPSKEIIVFTMACHSGGLVDTFNSMRSQWEGFAAQGRTLFVMSSSTVQQQSSTGPGADGMGGPSGSAGSAFGHALWKALMGEADGAFDGVKDGFLDLGEIEAYTKSKTKQVGGHDPTSTGSYNPGLVMNRVPTTADGLSFQDRGTGNWTTAQLQDEIKRTDDQWMGQQIGPMQP